MVNTPSTYTHIAGEQTANCAEASVAGAPLRLTCRVQVAGGANLNEAAKAGASESEIDDGHHIVVNLTIDGSVLAGGMPRMSSVAPNQASAVFQGPGSTVPLPCLPAPDQAVYPQEGADFPDYAPGPQPMRANLVDAIPAVFPAGASVPAPASTAPRSANDGAGAFEPDVQDPDFLFDQRHSMLDGLMEADREHSRRINRLRTSLIIIAAILALLLCAIALLGLAVERGLLDLPNLPFAGQQAEGDGEGAGNQGVTLKPSATTPQSDVTQKDEAQSGEEGETQSTTPQVQDLSGTMRYTYTTTASEGGKAQVTETVTYGKKGYAETTSMRLSFADEEVAKAFMERMECGYGTVFLGGTRNGTVVEVRIDVSDSRLDRTAYKQELAGTAQGLTATEVAQEKGSAAQGQPASGNTQGGSTKTKQPAE